MKEYFCDYWKLCKESFRWLKKHWKGYMVTCFVSTLICFIPMIVNYINEKKSTMEDEQYQV